MLFWPLVTATAIYFVFLTDSAKLIKDFTRDVMVKWTAAYVLFMIFYLYWKHASGSKEADFDPSGHIACCLIAQGAHMRAYLFT